MMGSMSSKVISFFLLPLYTSYLKVDDYGLYDLVSVYMQIAASVLFLDIWNATLRFIFDQKEKKDKYIPVHTGMLPFLCSFILMTVSVLIFSLFRPIPYLPLVLASGLLSNVTSYYSYCARGLGHNKLFALTGIVSTVVIAVTNIFCIVVLGLGVRSLFIAAIISSVVNIVLIEFKIKLLFTFKIKNVDIKLAAGMMTYALPLCLNSVSFWFLTNFSKVAINQYFSITENGLFAIGGKFSSMLNLVASCFSLAWQEAAFAKDGTTEQRGIFFSVAFDKYVRFMVSGALCLMPAIWFVFPYLIKNPEYAAAQNLTALNLTGTIFSIMSGFLASIFGNIMKTKFVFVSTLSGAIVNVALVYLLIPIFGVNGANLAFMFGYIVNVVFRVLLLRHYIGLKVDIKIVVISLVLLVTNLFMFFSGRVYLNAAAFIVGVIFFFFNFHSEIIKGFELLKAAVSKRKIKG